MNLDVLQKECGEGRIQSSYLIHTCLLIWRLQREAEGPQYIDVIHQIKWVGLNFTVE